jgi:hypothetical protein
VLPTATSFQEAVKKLKLCLDQYVHSVRLREWTQRNKNSKFPESLLQAWGFEMKKQPFTCSSLSSGSPRDAEADLTYDQRTSVSAVSSVQRSSAKLPGFAAHC